MGDDPFGLVPPANAPSGSPWLTIEAYATPSNNTPLVAPSPKTIAVRDLLIAIDAKADALNRLAVCLDEGTREVGKVRAALRALAVIADTMAVRGDAVNKSYKAWNGGQDWPSWSPTIELLQSQTKLLLKSFFEAKPFATRVDVRAIDTRLKDAIDVTQTEMWDLLKDPANVQKLKAWTDLVDWDGDWSQAPAAGKISGVAFTPALMYASAILEKAAAALAKFESEATLVEMAESIDNVANAERGAVPLDSLFHVTVSSHSALYVKMGAGTAGMAGQAIGPDGVYLRFIEAYALVHLPKAALKKAEASKLRLFLNRALKNAVGCKSKSDVDKFNGRYFKVADAQHLLASRKSQIEHAQRDLPTDIGVSPAEVAKARAKIDSAKEKLQNAEAKLAQAETNLVRELNPHQRIADALTQGTLRWKAFVVGLGAIQLCDSYSDFSEATNGLDRAKLTSDAAGVAAQMSSLSLDIGVGLLAMVEGNKKSPKVAVLLAKKLLCKFEIEAVAKGFAGLAKMTVPILGILSGGLEVLQGIRDGSPLLIGQGTLGLFAGGAQVYGFTVEKSLAARVAGLGTELLVGEAELIAGRVAVILVVGDTLGIVFFAVGVIPALVDLMTPGTEKVVDAIFDYLEKQSWGYGPSQNFMKALGLGPLLEQVKAAKGAGHFFQIPLTADPTEDRLLWRKSLLEELKGAGLSDEMAEACVEKA